MGSKESDKHHILIISLSVIILAFMVWACFRRIDAMEGGTLITWAWLAAVHAGIVISEADAWRKEYAEERNEEIDGISRGTDNGEKED